MRIEYSFTLAITALIGCFLFGAYGQRLVDHKHVSEMEEKLALLDAQAGYCDTVNKSCDRALLTCISWQVRVKYEIEVTNKILEKAFK